MDRAHIDKILSILATPNHLFPAKRQRKKKTTEKEPARRFWRQALFGTPGNKDLIESSAMSRDIIRRLRAL